MVFASTTALSHFLFRSGHVLCSLCQERMWLYVWPIWLILDTLSHQDFNLDMQESQFSHKVATAEEKDVGLFSGQFLPYYNPYIHLLIHVNVLKIHIDYLQ